MKGCLKLNCGLNAALASLKTFLEGDCVSTWHKLVCRMYAIVDYYELMALRLKFIIGEICSCPCSLGGQMSGDILVYEMCVLHGIRTYMGWILGSKVV